MLVYSIYFKHLELIPGVSKSCSLGPVLVAAEIGEYIRVGFRSSCFFLKAFLLIHQTRSSLLDERWNIFKKRKEVQSSSFSNSYEIWREV